MISLFWRHPCQLDGRYHATRPRSSANDWGFVPRLKCDSMHSAELDLYLGCGCPLELLQIFMVHHFLNGTLFRIAQYAVEESGNYILGSTHTQTGTV